MTPHLEIIHCVFDKTWLEMWRLSHEAAGRDDLIDDELGLIGRESESLFNGDLVQDIVEQIAGGG